MTQRVSQEIRWLVQQRAQDRCEYCHKPAIASLYSYHVDHIIPPMHGGDSKLENLAWACFQCNTAKGPNISSYDFETGQLTPLFNPRMQSWTDHFEMDGAIILGTSPTGRVTERILQFNHPDFVETRERIIRAGRW